MTKTAFFCTIGLIIASIYDLIAVQRFGVDYSISRWFQEVGLNSPFLILCIGYLLGHFFGFMPVNRKVFEVKTTREVYYIYANKIPNETVLARALHLEENEQIISIEELGGIKIVT